MKFILLVLLLILLSSLSPKVSAHQTRPLLFNVESIDGQHLILSWKIPEKISAAQFPQISLEGSCRVKAKARLSPESKQVLRRVGVRYYRCDTLKDGLSINLVFPAGDPGLMVMVKGDVLIDGELIKLARVFSPGESKLNLFAQVADSPALNPGNGGQASGMQYLVQGLVHISRGYDHLMFVLCLIFIAGGLKQVLLTVTGFTIAHSLTLVLSSLNLISVSVAATEAVIALSIVFLAAELVRANHQTLSFRRPVVVAILIGLLHGFGFASALQDIGLPEEHTLMALLMFNVGVELGQILFVLVMAPLLGLLRRFMAFELLGKMSAYIIGPLAGLWFIERLVS